MSKWDVDNMISHLAALSLYVDNFVTNITDLKDDLRLESNAMVDHFRELGCRVTSMNDSDRINLRVSSSESKGQRMAKLIIPLDFPKIEAKGNKKRRK